MILHTDAIGCRGGGFNVEYVEDPIESGTRQDLMDNRTNAVQNKPAVGGPYSLVQSYQTGNEGERTDEELHLGEVNDDGGDTARMHERLPETLNVESSYINAP